MGYTDEEIAVIRAKLASFENSQSFVLSFFDTIWLAEKEVIVDELSYDGVKIDRLFGCADEYFYASTRTKSTDKYTIHLLKVDYDTLEMTEIGQVENLRDSYSKSCYYGNEKLYFTDSSKYCVYDIETGTQEWFAYEYKEFWREEVGQYSFDIEASNVIIIDNITGTQKKVSWDMDLQKFEEGRYIQELDQKYTGFVCATQRDGVCYLAGQIPLDGGWLYNQIVIFAYNFESERLSYYGTAPYTEYNTPTLTIVNR